MKKVIFWIGIGIFLLLLIGIPLFIDWCIVGNNIPSNISNSDWVGFLGGYIGALLGAFFSVIGIAWTIKFTREQNRAERELQIRPFFDIRLTNEESFYHTKSWLGYVMVNTWDKDGEDPTFANPDKTDSVNVGNGLLHIRNVGNGPATNIDFIVFVEEIKYEYNAYFTNQNAMVTTNSILPGETSELTININNSRETPTKDDFVDRDGFMVPVNYNKIRIPEKFKIRLILAYDDLLFNHFHQELVFNASFGLTKKKDEDWKYACSIYLENVDSPQIVKRAK